MKTKKSARSLICSPIGLLLTSCSATHDEPIKFSAEVYYDSDSLPEYVQIQLKNSGDEYICIENSEINGRGGNITVNGFVNLNVGSPVYNLSKDGVYLGDGIKIIGPQTTTGELVELDQLTNINKNITDIRMILRYFRCDEIFKKNHIPHSFEDVSLWKKKT